MLNNDRSGNDGPWSSFLAGAGTPAQSANVLVSTTANQPWFVVPQGCATSKIKTCPSDRGGLYDPAQSSTWQAKGNYSLHYEEGLDYQGNGEYGFDTIRLGIDESSAPTLDNQLIAGIASDDFYIATLGIRPASTNLSSFNNPIPSFISNLKDRGDITSLSWAYTAGSYGKSQGKHHTMSQVRKITHLQAQ